MPVPNPVSRPLLFGGLLLTVSSLLAQSIPATRSTTQTARPSTSRQSVVTQKKALPDPDLLDGSAFEAEVRPDRGMLAEFELPGSEQRPEELAAAQSQQQAGQQGGGQQQGGGSSSGQQNTQGAGTGERPEGESDPNAKADGIAVAQLQVDENSAKQAAMPPRPREVAMGDASMQIPTAIAQQSVVGSEQQQQGGARQGVSNSQQYEKGAAAGPQTGNNQNKGLEKGRVIPEGL